MSIHFHNFYIKTIFVNSNLGFGKGKGLEKVSFYHMTIPMGKIELALKK